MRNTLALMQAAGYACYWILTDAIVPATGACWLNEFNTNLKWSNMLCAHEAPVLTVLDSIAREGYEERRASAAKSGR